MRVLALAHQYVPVRCAGAETMLHSMLRALAARGHQVDVTLSRQTGQEYTVDGVDVHPLVDRKRDVFRWLRDADLLVGHLDNMSRAVVLGALNRTAVVSIQHNTFDISRTTMTMPSTRVDLVVCNSQWMADDLRAWYATRRARQPETIIVRPLADPAEYATTPGDRVTLVNLRRSDGRPGRDGLSKGGETFRAVAERMPHTLFLGVTGAYGEQQDMSGLPNVEVLPHVPAHRMRDEVYARTRVLLMPSSYESWGRAAAEAICSGIPVVASPTPGLRECLGDAGIFVDWRDVDGYVRALRTLAMPNHWTHWSRRARARAEQLRPERDLAVWCDAAERVARRARILEAV